MSTINGTILQFFHWDLPNDGTIWNTLRSQADELARAGFAAVWIPPPYKGEKGIDDVGYGIYDLFDFGEFDQKGTIRTKYGTFTELRQALERLKNNNIDVYLDMVFNHKGGADATEVVRAIPVDWNNRGQAVGDSREIEAYTHFTFPGRGDRYSSMKWHWWHFDAVDYDNRNQNERYIYRLEGKSFDRSVSREYGNFDFLMYADLDMEHPEVKEELKLWGNWIINEFGFKGARIDAVKHIDFNFLNEWLDHIKRNENASNFFAVGEFFTRHTDRLHWFIQETGNRMSVFDFPLHFKFLDAGQSNGYYDMNNFFKHTLVNENPILSVTFVDNHDTFRDNPVSSWFKPLAYAMILLREGGYPCVFYKDYYGIGSNKSLSTVIKQLLDVRRNFAFGPQIDYFNDRDVVGWTRLGNQEHPKALAVLLSDGLKGSKWMKVERQNKRFRNIIDQGAVPVISNGDGWAEFTCQEKSVSIWIEESD